MCRWLAYYGAPVLIHDALYTPNHSLIDQSLDSKLGAEPTNGDGVGIGWYGDQPTPGRFRSIEPAWNDENLNEITAHVRSPLFFAHIRAAIGSPVQQTNCHPYRHGRWLFMHNGCINDVAKIKRDLVMAVDPSLYNEIKGSTDTEVIFYLALTLGLEDDPPEAISHTIGLIETLGRDRGIEFPFQGTIATSNGESLWAFRYSTEGKSRSLFVSRDVHTLKHLYPEREILNQLSENARLVVSEPIGDLPGAWVEVPESSWGVVGPNRQEIHTLTIKHPPAAVPVPA